MEHSPVVKLGRTGHGMRAWWFALAGAMALGLLGETDVTESGRL